MSLPAPLLSVTTDGQAASDAVDSASPGLRIRCCKFALTFVAASVLFVGLVGYGALWLHRPTAPEWMQSPRGFQNAKQSLLRSDGHATPLENMTLSMVDSSRQPHPIDLTISRQHGPFYVFLVVYRLSRMGVYHSAVRVCPRANFNSEDQNYLDQWIANAYHYSYAEMDYKWCNEKSNMCQQLEYGASDSNEECSGVQLNDYPLNSHFGNWGREFGSGMWMYIYGTGCQSGAEVMNKLCTGDFTTTWSGAEYGLVSQNCNTFTSFILGCWYGLSYSKPNLFWSALMDIPCEKDVYWQACRRITRPTT